MNQKKLKLIKKWAKPLFELNSQGIDALIAGGALRDMYHSKMVSDIDIFLPYSDFNKGFADSLCSEVFKVNTVQQKPYDYFNPDIVTVTSGHMSHTKRMTYQFIMYNSSYFSNTLDFINKTFDYGICFAYMDSKGVRYTSEFLEDASNRTFTLRNVDTKYLMQAMPYHLNKLKAKYPGFKLHDPYGMQSLIEQHKKPKVIKY